MNHRTFICIDFPDEIIKEIARIQPLIKKQKFTGKLTELENLHVTLKFLGELSDEELKKVKEKLKEIKHKELNLKLEKTGIFQYKGKPRIVWAKVAGNIFALQKKIDEALKDNYKKEDRFMSHMTIARIKHVKDINSFYKYITNLKLKKFSFQINSFKLKTSELRPQGPIFTTIEEYDLSSTFEKIPKTEA